MEVFDLNKHAAVFRSYDSLDKTWQILSMYVERLNEVVKKRRNRLFTKYHLYTPPLIIFWCNIVGVMYFQKRGSTVLVPRFVFVRQVFIFLCVELTYSVRLSCDTNLGTYVHSIIIFLLVLFHNTLADTHKIHMCFQRTKIYYLYKYLVWHILNLKKNI